MKSEKRNQPLIVFIISFVLLSIGLEYYQYFDRYLELVRTKICFIKKHFQVEIFELKWKICNKLNPIFIK